MPQPGDVPSAWDEAAQAWEAVGQPYPLAVALLRSAEAALSAGDRDGGTARLRRAADLAQRLGARPLSDDIALLARRARISLGRDGDAAGEPAAADPAGHPGIPEADRLGLTSREFEVLRLVAAGRSNREIAGELFISAKTASVHVSNILSKLRVAGRGEAAATAHRLRLFDSFPPWSGTLAPAHCVLRTALPVGAENRIHGSDQQSCSLGALSVMITRSCACGSCPPDHATNRVAAAVPA